MPWHRVTVPRICHCASSTSTTDGASLVFVLYKRQLCVPSCKGNMFIRGCNVLESFTVAQQLVSGVFPQLAGLRRVFGNHPILVSSHHLLLTIPQPWYDAYTDTHWPYLHSSVLWSLPAKSPNCTCKRNPWTPSTHIGHNLSWVAVSPHYSHSALIASKFHQKTPCLP
jgi:hypothetical protein